MTDLGALVIMLRATGSLTIRPNMGRAAQQLCLGIIHEVDAALTEELHDTYQVKPYAVSGLLLPDSTRPVEGTVAPGDPAWVRLVGLRADVVSALDKSISAPRVFASGERDQLPANKRPAVWKEDGITFVQFDYDRWIVESFTWTDHPWAGQATYGGLIRHHLAATPPEAIQFEFVSPTAFSSADLNIPLPDPLRVFDNLRQQWSVLNPLPAAFALPDTFMDFVRHFVPLTKYSAHSEVVQLDTPEIGFCAEQVKFTIKPRSKVNNRLRVKHPDRADALDALNSLRDDLARGIALLSDFAFFSGVGIKTTTGMGMVRRL